MNGGSSAETDEHKKTKAIALNPLNDLARNLPAAYTMAHAHVAKVNPIAPNVIVDADAEPKWSEPKKPYPAKRVIKTSQRRMSVRDFILEA